VDRHQIGADPDRTFHFDGDPDSTPSFTHVGKPEFFLLFFTAVPVSNFIS
jgi:hypothetical protein